MAIKKEEPLVRVAIPMTKEARVQMHETALRYRQTVAEFVRDSVNETLLQAGDVPIDFGVRDWRKND